MGDGEDRARRVIAANAFMTLATADGAGTPWATPVWFAPAGPTDWVWLSKPHRRHSVNIAERPEVAVVVYDSTQAPGTGEAVYGTGRAATTDAAHHLDAFNARCREQGLAGWRPTESDLRLYHVVVDALWVLDDAEDRVPVVLDG